MGIPALVQPQKVEQTCLVLPIFPTIGHEGVQLRTRNYTHFRRIFPIRLKIKNTASDLRVHTLIFRTQLVERSQVRLG